MKVRAKCNIKHGSRWIPEGTELDVNEDVYAQIRDYVETADERNGGNRSPVPEPEETEAPVATRTRKRK